MSSHSAMSNRFVILAEFASADETLAAEDRLEAGGIAVRMEVDAMAGWSWHDPATRPRARLLVAETDYAEALGILASTPTGQGRTASAPVHESAWFCPKCDTEVEPFLDVCWACGTTRDGQEDPEFASVVELPERQGRAGEAHGESTEDDRGPVGRRRQLIETARYWPDATADFGVDRQPDLDEVLTHAWRTSVLGVFCLPPLLTLYSTWLVVKYFVLFDGVVRRGHGRLYIALALNLIVLLVVGYMAHLQITHWVDEPIPAAAIEAPDAPSTPYQQADHRPR